MTAVEPTLEAEYWFSCKEVAFRWNVDEETIRRRFLREPGVKVIPTNTPGKRTYRTLRIPESVLRRVEARMTVPEVQPPVAARRR